MLPGGGPAICICAVSSPNRMDFTPPTTSIISGDYNNCSHTCPRRDRVMLEMERELGEKERGLLKVSLDNEGYYRADELYHEVELVLEATCTACAAGR